MKKEEHHLQVILCQYLDWNGYDFFSIPNGGLRHPRVGNALKAEGLKAGAADLFIVLANNTHHGLFIEVKFADGKQQPNQKKFQSMVEHHGYCYKIVRSLDDLIDVLRIFKSDPIIDQYQAGYRSGYMDGKLQEQILK